MRTWNKLFWLCLIGMILLAAGIIFLPRYFSRGLDMGKMNQVQLAERENFSFLEQSSDSILDNARAFRYLNSADNNLMLISSYDESAKINSELLEAVYSEAMNAAETGAIPWISSIGYYASSDVYSRIYAEDELDSSYDPWMYWGQMVRFARYYSLTYPSHTGSNTKEMLNFWYLRFSDGETFDYYFLVNAATYQIYYARIHNFFTDWIVKYWNKAYRQGDISSESDDANSASTAVDIYDASGKKAQRKIYDAESHALSEEVYWLFADFLGTGCQDYYGADDLKNIYNNSRDDRISLLVLNYGTEAIYLEQLAVPGNTFPYRGISIGLQNLGENIQKLTTQ